MMRNDEPDPIEVMLDYKDTQYFRPFYCCKCGKCVCEISGNIKILVPGIPDEIDIKTFGFKNALKCSGVIYMGHNNRIRCTAKYFFT